MAVLLTGVTGFLGSYLAAELLKGQDGPLCLLVRARRPKEAEGRLWRSLQLHFDYDSFQRLYRTRMKVYLGDITQRDLGLSAEAREDLRSRVDSVIHCAASLNRRSYEICLNVNVKGTLEVVKFAQELVRRGTFRRFSNVSTVAVSGHRRGETVKEEGAIRWNAPDLDAYGATKKMAEHLVRELLPQGAVLTFRPSAIIGDSRFAATTQFDMVRAFAWLAKAPALPLNPDWRIDIVPADFTARAIAELHRRERPKHDIYHLSAGTDSLSYREVVAVLGGGRRPFLPGLQRPFTRLCDWLSDRHPNWRISRMATLLKFFMPHLVENTVYDNARLKEELGEGPPSFGAYAKALMAYAEEHHFKYPYRPFPEPPVLEAAS